MAIFGRIAGNGLSSSSYDSLRYRWCLSIHICSMFQHDFFFNALFWLSSSPSSSLPLLLVCLSFTLLLNGIRKTSWMTLVHNKFKWNVRSSILLFFFSSSVPYVMTTLFEFVHIRLPISFSNGFCYVVIKLCCFAPKKTKNLDVNKRLHFHGKNNEFERNSRDANER